MVRLTGSWSLVAAFGAAVLCAKPTASQHAAAGCPYDKLWIGSTCPRVHFRMLVREDGEHRGCCIGGGREGQCPENCARQTVNADGSCSCGQCDPPQPPECTATSSTGKVSLLALVNLCCTTSAARDSDIHGRSVWLVSRRLHRHRRRRPAFASTKRAVRTRTIRPRASVANLAPVPAQIIAAD